MRKLWLDFETRSKVDLIDSGRDRYCKDVSTEVLMLAWAYDNDEPKLWLPALGEPMPEALKVGLLDPDVQKMAWNYNFEKSVFKYGLGIDIPQGQWFDPSILCAYMALPTKLERAADAFNLDIENKKIVITGKNKPTKLFSEESKRLKGWLKKNPGAAPTYYKDWTTHPEEWKIFCEYCLQDVRAERAIYHAAVNFNCPIPTSEIQAWLIDQRMNEHGVWIDLVYVNAALKYALAEAEQIIGEMKAITGLENPNSTTHQLKPWMQKHGYPFNSMDKEHVEEALKEQHRYDMTPDAIKVLELKQKLGGSAYKKLQSILDRVSVDGYLRDQFKYHGAHTGRWSGRGVQLQNLFKANPEVSKVLDAVTQAIKNQTLDIPAIRAEYNAKIDKWNAENPEKKKDHVKPFTIMDAIAGTIRSAFRATPGSKFVMCDLAQIESRVLAALAGCMTMINAYKSGLDLYKDIMSFLLEKPYDKIDKKERANGKVIILGCGFGMGWEKFIDYAATFGVTLDEATAKRYVKAFREKYVEIPNLWKALDSAVVKAVKLNICVYVNGMVVDGRNPEMLKIKLPNGRCLHYLRPVVTEETTEWGAVREGVSYESWDEKGLNMKRLYGGLICENVVQAVARDVLVSGMIEAEKMGFIITMTIHDELVCEALIEAATVLTYKMLEQAMTTTPDWAEGMGFILAAEGDESIYYKK